MTAAKIASHSSTAETAQFTRPEDAGLLPGRPDVRLYGSKVAKRAGHVVI